jgi:hypothetical protein
MVGIRIPGRNFQHVNLGWANLSLIAKYNRDRSPARKSHPIKYTKRDPLPQIRSIIPPFATDLTVRVFLHEIVYIVNSKFWSNAAELRSQRVAMDAICCVRSRRSLRPRRHYVHSVRMVRTGRTGRTGRNLTRHSVAKLYFWRIKVRRNSSIKIAPVPGT